MAQQRFSGNAPAVSQVNTITVGGTPANGQIYSVSIPSSAAGKTVSYTASGADTNTTIAAALTAALVAASSGYPEFGQITWTSSNNVITGTANTAGTPFTQVSSATGTGTLVTATPTPNSSPNDWNNAANWQTIIGGVVQATSTVPANNDDVFLDLANVPIYWGLNQSGVTLNSLNIPASFTSALGLPQYNLSGFLEYRPLYLAISATNIYVGYGSGNGSGLLRINVGTVLTTLTVYNTAPQSTEPNAYALQFQNNNVAGCTVVVNKGNVGIAARAGEQATLAVLDVGYISNQNSDATVFCGPGCAVGAINQTGGILTTTGTISSTINHYAGTHTLLDASASNPATVGGNVNIDGGTIYYNGTGTIGGLVTLNNGGSLLFTQDPRARKVTNLTALAGSTMRDPNSSVTWLGAPFFSGCTLEQVDFNFGYNRHVTLS